MGLGGGDRDSEPEALCPSDFGGTSPYAAALVTTEHVA